MGGAVGEILPLAVAVAVSPIPIIAVVLLLSTPRGTANALSLMLGYIVGLVVVGAIVLLVSGGADASERGGPADWVSWLKLILAALMFWLAVRYWRSRPRGGTSAELPGWMRTIDRITPGRATAIGVALTAINPKNLILTVGAATTIAQTGISGSRQAASLAVFVVIACLGPAVPIAIDLTMRERATKLLTELQTWLAAHNAAIMAVICLLIAAKLAGDAISGLA